jgi:LssY C-terminus
MTQIAGRRRWRIVLVGVLIAYPLRAYVILPALWSHHEHEPGLASLPMVTRTAQGIPDDALNVGLVGSSEDVLRAMHAAGWFPADAITLRSSIEIVGDRRHHVRFRQVLDKGTDGRPVWLGSHLRPWGGFEP